MVRPNFTVLGCGVPMFWELPIDLSYTGDFRIHSKKSFRTRTDKKEEPGVPASGMVPLRILTPPMGRIDGRWSSQSSDGAGGTVALPMRWCRWSLE